MEQTVDICHTMNDSISPIIPLSTRGLKDRNDLGDKPELIWISLDKLVVNAEYQRKLSKKSITLIRKLYSSFDWSRVKALSVVTREDGLYEITDGQHTAISAATRGDIEALPCLAVKGSGRRMADNAASFVAINQDRVAMTSMAIFWAKHAAEDEDAMDVVTGCTAVGAKVLRTAKAPGYYKPGETIAIGSLMNLASKGGPIYVRRVMRILTNANMAPVKAIYITALQNMLWPHRKQNDIDDPIITAALLGIDHDAFAHEARNMRDTMKKPRPALKKVLSDMIEKRCRDIQRD